MCAKFVRPVLLCIVLLSSTFPSAAAVWYVNSANASGTLDGASWATAFSSIQAGVDAAGAAGGGEVWVAQGEYAERVAITASGVGLYGGFAGSEASRDERPSGTRSTINPYPPENSYVELAGILVEDCGQVTVERMAVIGPQERYLPYLTGIMCKTTDDSVMIQDCEIAGMSKNGLVSEDSSVRFIRCFVHSCFPVSGDEMAVKQRQAISCSRGGIPAFIDCEVADNNGWGLFATGLGVDLKRCIIRGNQAGGLKLFGFGYVDPFLDTDGMKTLQMENCIVADNGAYATSPGIDLLCIWRLRMDQCTVLSSKKIWAKHALVTSSRVENGGYLTKGLDVQIANSLFLARAGSVFHCYDAANTLIHVYSCALISQNEQILSTDRSLYPTVPSFEQAYASARNNVSGPISFVSELPGPDYYKPSPNTFVIDNGSLEKALPSDIAGNPRPGNDGLVDIGAYELAADQKPSADSSFPQDVHVIAPEVSYQSSFDISWFASDPGSGIAQAELYYRKPGGNWIKYGDADLLSSTVFVDTTLTGGFATYEFALHLTDRAGNKRPVGETADATVLVVDAPPDAARVYVNNSARGKGTGLSWADAMHSINWAFYAAKSNGIGEIWIAEGTYAEVLDVPSDIVVRGSFAGTETDPSQRNMGKHTTTLNPNTYGGALSNAVLLDGVDHVLLDGFTITGCVANPLFYYSNLDSPSFKTGDSAVRMRNTGGDIRLENCTIEYNSGAYSSAIVCWGEGLALSNCRLSNNTIEGLQSYVGVLATSNLEMDDCLIYENSIATECERSAAAVHFSYGKVERCTISNNGMPGIRGGGVTPSLSIEDSEDLINRVKSCTIAYNIGDDGGVVRGCNVVDSHIHHNTASEGGGVYGCNVINSYIHHNTAQTGGGASESALQNCILEANTAEMGGGAHNTKAFRTLFKDNVAQKGGGYSCDQSWRYWIYHDYEEWYEVPPTISGPRNCVFWNNEAPMGSCAYIAMPCNGRAYAGQYAVYVLNMCTFVTPSPDTDQIYADSESNAYLKNCILSGIGSSAGNPVSYTYCLVGAEGIPGTGVITGNPMFNAPENGDFRLLPGSPCIDSSPLDPTERFSSETIYPPQDFNGVPRPQGSALDMGAFEFVPDEDTDGDGLTNGEERELGTNPYRSDTDRDGLTDGFEESIGLNPLDPSDAANAGLPAASCLWTLIGLSVAAAVMWRRCVKAR